MLRYTLLVAALTAASLGASPAAAQAPNATRIIDMHTHAYAAADMGPPPVAICVPFESFPAWDPAMPYGAVFGAMLKQPSCANPVWSPVTDSALMHETIAAMERLGMIGVLSGSPERVAAWMAAAPGRFIPGLSFNLLRDTIPPDSLRRLVESGKVAVLAEVYNQYSDIAPDDERMAPYWALAEELDLPVGIHIGPGPPGVRYVGIPGMTGMRAALHSPLTLEPVLLRHPRLRVYVMHAGYPMLDDMVAMLYTHPQLHVDISVIAYTNQRPAFYRYLEALVDAGFTNRIMFGSDQMVWPGVMEQAVKVIEEAPFLTDAQKHAILYANAARFLRLP